MKYRESNIVWTNDITLITANLEGMMWGLNDNACFRDPFYDSSYISSSADDFWRRCHRLSSIPIEFSRTIGVGECGWRLYWSTTSCWLPLVSKAFDILHNQICQIQYITITNFEKFNSHVTNLADHEENVYGRMHYRTSLSDWNILNLKRNPSNQVS